MSQEEVSTEKPSHDDRPFMLTRACGPRSMPSSQLLPEDTVWGYFAQLVQALDACHNRRTEESAAGDPPKTLLHRDIKPENVFLDHENNIKLGDFGLSKELQGAVSFANTYVGTPYYMSPELTTGAAYDVKSDIWALACVIFELCALAPPFDAHSQAELTLKIKSGQVPRLPRAYSQELNHVVRTMLDLQPRRRPTTKQLLEVPQIRVTAQALELTTLARQLKEREAALLAREEAFEEKAAGANRLHAHQDFFNEEYEAELERRKGELEAGETRLVWKEKELEDKHERLVNELRLREHQMQSEFEATVQREVERRVKAELAARNTQIGSSSSVAGTSTSSARRKKSLVNLSSAAKSSESKGDSAAIDEWGALPKAASDRVVAESSRRQSNDLPTRDSPTKPTLNHAPRSEPISRKSLYASPTQDRRPPHPPVSARKSMSSLRTGRVGQLLERERYNPAADKSDTTMKDVTVDEKENDSMYGGVPGSPALSLLKQQRARRITLDQKRRSEDQAEQDNVDTQEPDQDVRSGSGASGEVRSNEQILQDLVGAGLSANKHDSASSLLTHPHSRPSSAAGEQQAGQTEAAGAAEVVPIYDISNDPDLPSPFLRKPTSKAATSLVGKLASAKAKGSAAGPTSLVQRAAALRAAQNTASAGKTTTGDVVGASTLAKLRTGSDRPRASIVGVSTTTATLLPPAEEKSARASPTPTSSSSSSTSSSTRKGPGSENAPYSPTTSASASAGRERPRSRPSALSSIPSLGSGSGQGPRRSFYGAGAPSAAAGAPAVPLVSASARE